MRNPQPQRKRPVHMPPVERHNAPVILLVTIGVQPRQSVLANGPFMRAFRTACADADGWSVGQFVVMPDHVHMVCSPARCPAITVKRWCTYLKERIAKRLKAEMEGEAALSRHVGNGSPPDFAKASSGKQARPPGGDDGERPANVEGEPVASRISWKWQSDCWDTQMRDGQHYHDKWEYVQQNPVRKGLVERAEDWPWRGELNVLRW